MCGENGLRQLRVRMTSCSSSKNLWMLLSVGVVSLLLLYAFMPSRLQYVIRRPGASNVSHAKKQDVNTFVIESGSPKSGSKSRVQTASSATRVSPTSNSSDVPANDPAADFGSGYDSSPSASSQFDSTATATSITESASKSTSIPTALTTSGAYISPTGATPANASNVKGSGVDVIFNVTDGEGLDIQSVLKIADAKVPNDTSSKTLGAVPLLQKLSENQHSFRLVDAFLNKVAQLREHTASSGTRITNSYVESIKDQYTNLLNPYHPAPFTELEMRERMAYNRSEADFRERRKTLAEGCKNLGLQMRSKTKVRPLVIPPLNATVCLIPKVGSTYMHRMLQVGLISRPGLHSPYQITLNSASVRLLYRKEILTENMRSTTNVLTVRDPYSRLLSGYLDKLFSNNHHYWRGQGRRAAAVSRGGGIGDFAGNDVTFAEFVHFVVKTQGNRDPHFIPQSQQICFSCSVNYTYILKAETYRDDSFFLMDRWGLLGTKVYFKDAAVEAAVDQIVGKVSQVFLNQDYVLQYLSLTDALLRTWRFVQIHGYIDKTTPFPEDLGKKSYEEVIKVFLHHYLHRSPAVKQQRGEATLQAFMTVREEDLRQFRELFRADFDLFGYNSSPDPYFKDRADSEKKAKEGFRYFDVINNFYSKLPG